MRYVPENRHKIVVLVKKMQNHFHTKLHRAIEKGGNEISNGIVNSDGNLFDKYIEIISSSSNAITKVIKRNKTNLSTSNRIMYSLDDNITKHLEWRQFKNTLEYRKCVDHFQRQTPNRDKKTKEKSESHVGKKLKYESDGEDVHNENDVSIVEKSKSKSKSYVESDGGEDVTAGSKRKKDNKNLLNSPEPMYKKVCTTSVVTISSRKEHSTSNNSCEDIYTYSTTPKPHNIAYHFLDPNKSPNSNFPKMSEVLQNATHTILSELNKVTTLGHEIADLCKVYANKHQVEAGLASYLINMGKQITFSFFHTVHQHIYLYTSGCNTQESYRVTK